MGTEQKSEVRQHWPFIRVPLRMQHFIPGLGLYFYGREERRLMNAVPPETKIHEPNNRFTGPMTLWVSTWPEPQNNAEWKEHITTQAIHGGMLAYHFVWGFTLIQLLFTARARK